MCEVRKMGESSRFNFGVSYASKNGNNVREHRHECYEIVYYLSCSGYTEIDGGRYEFSPGTLAFLPPQTPHTEVCEHGGKVPITRRRHAESVPSLDNLAKLHKKYRDNSLTWRARVC